MSTFEEKVAKAGCKEGDVVIDGSNPYSEPHMVTKGGLFPLLNIPFTNKEKVGDSVSIRIPGFTAEKVNVSDVTQDQIKASNSIIVESEGAMIWYKLYDWSGTEWIAWDAKEIRIFR